MSVPLRRSKPRVVLMSVPLRRSEPHVVLMSVPLRRSEPHVVLMSVPLRRSKPRVVLMSVPLRRSEPRVVLISVGIQGFDAVALPRPGPTHNRYSRSGIPFSFVPIKLYMTIMELPSLIRSLTLIDDRRNNKNKRYPLPLLLLIAFCASISKHDSWYTMQDYAQAHEASIRELYKQLFGEELEHVTPSHDTLESCLASHSPQGLQGGLSKLDCGSPTVG